MREHPRARRTVIGALVLAAGIGLSGTAVAATAESGPSKAARAAWAESAAPGTPCSVSVRACVDLETRQAWLVDKGKVVRGPLRVTIGGKGQETPVGHSFRVYRKERDHRSGEYKGPDGRPARMPYTVFFADGGVAFHGGNLNRASAGCVKLGPKDAPAFFDFLQVGDKVQVVHGSVERKERAKAHGGR
ncbi:L,D-transpeptidase [Pseudonocardia phyllosphaerae]|uniref:L,D-transpeptidase n=1 Tax=Pseudonocardia phyllosphaerae TaxID=3390502 RepID=UPI00397888BD